MSRGVRFGFFVVVALAACAGVQPAPRRADDVLAIPSLAPSVTADGGAVPSASLVQVRRRAARPGDRYRVAVRATTRESTSWGFEERTTYDTAYDVEVLRAEGSVASRLRVSYDHNVRTSRGRETRTPVDGLTYTLDAANRVRLLDGGEVPASREEAELLSDMFPDLGAPGSVDSALRDGPLRVGEDQDGLARAIARLVHPRAVTLASGSATLVRADAEDGALEFALDMVLDWQMGSRARVRGTARVRTDGRLLRVALRGPFEDPDGGPRGEIAYEREVSYAE